MEVLFCKFAMAFFGIAGVVFADKKLWMAMFLSLLWMVLFIIDSLIVLGMLN